MADAPQEIVIELEDKDIHKDLVQVVTTMGAIRREQIQQNQITDERKNEYLHLTYRLASMIKSQSDERLVKKMQKVADKLNKTPALRTYDFMQDHFWRTSDPEFTGSLDSVLIHLMEDDFSTLEDRHHIINALKFLGVQDAPLKERLAVYDTILPFHTPKEKNNRQVFEEFLNRSGIRRYNTEGLTVNIKADISKLEKLIETATNAGFAYMDLVVDHSRLEKIKEKYPEYSLMQVIEQDYKKDLKKLKVVNPRPKKSSTKNLLDLAFHYIMGNASGNVQRNLERRIQGFKVENATSISIFTNFVGSLAYLLYSGISHAFKLNLPGADDPGSAAIFGGFELFRFTYWGAKNEGQKSMIIGAGNPLGTALFFPLSAYFRISNYLNKKENRVKDNPKLEKVPCLIRFSLNEIKRRQAPALYTSAKNYHVGMEETASQQLPQELEENLNWTLENHHTQGKYFERELKRKSRVLGEFEQTPHLSRETGAITNYNIKYFSPYSKVSAVVSFPNRRYVLTAMTNSEKPFHQDEFEKVTEILSKGEDLKTQLGNISQAIHSPYAHITEFRNGGKTADLTLKV